MGNWNINIQGVGCHHNGGRLLIDANRMAAKFVKELKEAGHHVEAATFTSGSKDELIGVEGTNDYYPVEAAAVPAD